MIFYEIGVCIDGTIPERCASGTSYPSSPSNGDRCYRTDLNRLYVYRTVSSSWIEKEALPLGIVRSSGTAGKVGSIDQIFKGFGYIGSTVFALPGVKVQQAIGFDRNMPKSEIQTIPNVVIAQSAGNNGFYDGQLRYTDLTIHSRNVGHLSFNADRNLVIDDEYPNAARGIILYNYSTDATGKIKTFNSASIDLVANSNASNFSQAGRSLLAGLSMPSYKYTNITWGTSGTQYTAPANGYFWARGNWASSGSNFYITMDVLNKIGVMTETGASGPTFGKVLCPVVKGDVVLLYYNAVTMTDFKFIYSEGEN